MAKQVVFNSNVGGAQFVIYSVQGQQVSAGPSALHFNQQFNDSMLVVGISISAPNGTLCTVTYQCSSNGQPTADPAKPSPVNILIKQFNTATVTLQIPI